MLRGLLKRESIILSNFQKLIDPIILIIIYSIVFEKAEFFSISQIFFFPIITFVLNINRIYESHRIKILFNIIPKIFYICSSLTILNLFFMDLNNIDNSTFIVFFTLCFGYLFLHHFILRFLLRRIRRKGFNSRNAVFVGNKESYKKLLEELKRYPWIGYRIIFWFSPNSKDYKEKKEINLDSLNCHGGIIDIKNSINLHNIDKIFFSHNDTDEITFEKLIEILGDTFVPISLLIDWEINSLSLNKEYFGDLLTLNIWNSDESNFYLNIKASIDFIFALSGIVFLSPLFFLISLAIKIESKGPILFVQKRYGAKGKIFKMYKFRTMYEEKERNHKFLEQAKLGDIRVTKLGRFLRKFSIDEFPQLINVLKGDMSLIGPRPHAIDHNEFYRKLIVGYMQRHSRKPGMTGLAQIKGARGETRKIESMELRIKYDLEYINNLNLINDLIIFFKTFFHIFKGEAY